MPEIKLDRALLKRDLERIPMSELLEAARWWARNATNMPLHDPWRLNLQTIPFVALITPSVAAFGKWLEYGHEATRGINDVSPFQACYVELVSEKPPWSVASAVGDGPQLHDAHRVMGEARWLAEMRSILDEIRESSKNALSSNVIIPAS